MNFNKTPEVKPVIPETPPPVSDKDKPIDLALNHLLKIRANVDNYRGKDGMNPLMWLRLNRIDQLELEVKAGNAQAWDKVMAIPSDVQPRV